MIEASESDPSHPELDPFMKINPKVSQSCLTCENLATFPKIGHRIDLPKLTLVIDPRNEHDRIAPEVSKELKTEMTLTIQN